MYREGARVGKTGPFGKIQSYLTFNSFSSKLRTKDTKMERIMNTELRKQNLNMYKSNLKVSIFHPARVSSI